MRERALVTGSSGGIGEDLARLLAAGGRDVVLVARSADKLRALAAELSHAHNIDATVIEADLSNPGAVTDIVAALAQRGHVIDILVNNAGFGSAGAFAREDPDVQLSMLQVNVVSLTALTRQLLPGMLERRRGRILNVASTAAFQSGPFMAVYYATKAYVLSLSQALSEETAGTGVTVTCLCPGPTHTGFQERAKLAESPLFKSASVMTSAEVARTGYDAMMAGRSLVIAGLLNSIGAQLTRFVPRRLAARIAGSVNVPR